MRSEALNRAFNRALVDLEYRHELFADVRRVLRDMEVSEEEISFLESVAPRDIRELAQALKQQRAS